MSAFGSQSTRIAVKPLPSKSHQEFLPITYTRILIVLLVLIPGLCLPPCAKGQVDALRVGMPSPTASSLGEYGEVPVNLFTGSPSIEVPIHTVSGVSMELPIRLTYKASGVQVASIPSWVGMGWALQAGGAITRTTRGLPDDAVHGYLETGSQLSDPVWNDARAMSSPSDVPASSDLHHYLEDVESGIVDPQPDQFFFNVAGVSGQFVLGEDGNAHLESRQNVQLEYTVSSSIPKPTGQQGLESGITQWTLTTEDGTQYVFGRKGIRSGIEVSIHDVWDVKNSEQVHCNSHCYWVSAWYLVEVISPTGDETIELDYHDPVIVSHDRKPSVRTYIGAGNDCPSASETRSNTTVQTRRLKTIRSETQTLHFESSLRSGFMTNDEYMLDAVRVEAVTGETMRSILFGYDARSVYSDRLLLTEVETKGSNGTTSGGTHAFEYHEDHSLPGPQSYDVDHWGFFNAAGNTAKTPETISVNPFDGSLVHWSGNDRSPDTSAIKTGVLTDIQHPTGGRTTLEYEVHDFGYVGRGIHTRPVTAKEGDRNQSSAGHLAPVDGLSPNDPNNPDLYREETPFTFTNVDDHPTEVELTYSLSDPAGGGCRSECAKVKLLGPDGQGIWSQSAADDVVMNQSDVMVIEDPGTYTLVAEADVRDPELTASAGVRATWKNRVSAKTNVGSGLRIRKITNWDGVGIPSVKTYHYESLTDPDRSSGVLQSEPRYWYNGSGTCAYTSVASEPVAGLGMTQGSPVGYKAVTVHHGDTGGYTLHRFRSYSDIVNEHEVGPSRPSDDLYWPFGLSTNVDFKVGQPLERSTFDQDSQNSTSGAAILDGARLVRRTETKHEFSDTAPSDGTVDFIRALTINRASPSFTYVDPYQIVSSWTYPTSRTTTTYEPGTNDSLVSTTDFRRVIDSNEHAFMQLRSKTIRLSTGEERMSTFTYAHEIFAGMRANANHQLSQKYSIEQSDGKGRTTTKTWTTWSANDHGFWTPSEEWVWRGDPNGGNTTPSELPASAGTCDQIGEVICAKQYSAYDEFGRATETVDANGSSTFFSYGGEGAPGGGTSAGDVAFLTETWTWGDDGRTDTLSVSYNYNSLGSLTSMTEENGHVSSFAYDGLGRLSRAYGPDGGLIVEHDYHYTTGDPAIDPSYVRTERPGGTSPTSSTTTYVDGLGRAWQTHQEIEGGRVATTQKYDAAGRPHKSYRPYDEQSGAFQAAVPVGLNPTETVYEASPLDRPDQLIHPDGAVRQTDYGVENVPSGGLCGQSALAGTYASTTTTDEVGDVTTTYTDGFGQTVATVADPGGIAATTCFEYDATGDLTRVTKPEGDAVMYRYDRRGLMVERTSPDAGTTRIVYDAAGNVRFTRDANRAAADEFVFTTYDPLGRPLVTGTESGVTEPMFEALDPQVAQPFEADTTTWRHVRVYDAVPPSSQYPWSAPWAKAAAPSIDEPSANLNGRLASQAHRSNGSWRIVYFTYDAEGHITQKFVRGEVDPSLDADFTYTYDRQGRLTNRTVRIPATAEGVAYWYEYNDRGLVKAMYAKQDPGPTPTRPPFADLQLTYTADQQIDTLRFHGLEPIAYDHTSRGFVASIGAQSPYFHASYSYYDDGNVSSVTASQPGLGSGADDSFTYSFGYDPLDRLVAGNFNHAGDNRFDVSLTYDSNGNIKTLRRHGSTGEVLDDLTYTYDAELSGHSDSPNRLRSIADGGSGTTAWDARGGDFSYDPSGNMLQAPAPYALQAVTYNEGNLPTQVSTPAGTTHYHYSAGGQRTRSILPGGDTEITIRDGSVVIGRFRNGDLEHWNLVLPSGEVVGRIEP